MRDLEKEQLFSNLLYALFNGWVLFSYKKANGNEHIGIGTLNTNIIVNNIGYEFKTVNSSPCSFKTRICKYYDILYMGWRSFNIDNIKDVYECNLSPQKVYAYALRLHYGGLNLEASGEELASAIDKATDKKGSATAMVMKVCYEGMHNIKPLEEIDLYNLSKQISEETCYAVYCEENDSDIYEEILLRHAKAVDNISTLNKILSINNQIAELVKEQQFLIIKLQQDEKD